jgi:hypothetical protein
MPRGQTIQCKNYPDCKFRAPHKSLLEHHYKNECEYEEEIIDHWVPHGVVVQTAADAALVAEKAAAAAAKSLDNIFKDAAAEVAVKAAAAARKAADEVAMCGRLTLKSLNFFSHKGDKDKYMELYPTITKKREIKCEAMKDIWDNNDYYTDDYEENRLDDIMETKNFTFTYKSCSCREHFTINSRYEAINLNKKYQFIRQCRDKTIDHYYKHCETTAVAFKNKDLDNPMYKLYAEKYTRTWPDCRYCQAEHTSKANHETHEWKCKYNPKNLMQIPIFEEVDMGSVLQYNFFQPHKVFVNKKDIKKLINSFRTEVIAYALDFNNKPLVRYRIHQVNKSRKPQDFNSDNPSYPFKHLYAYREDTGITTDIFDWDL